MPFLLTFLGQTPPVLWYKAAKEQEKRKTHQLKSLRTSYHRDYKDHQPEGPYFIDRLFFRWSHSPMRWQGNFYIKNDKLALLVLVDTPNYSKYPVGNIYIMGY